MLLERIFDNANLVYKVLKSQELYGNLEEHELELKRYKKNGDEKEKEKENVLSSQTSRKLDLDLKGKCFTSSKSFKEA